MNAAKHDEVSAHIPRRDWTREEIRALFALPFPELIFRALTIHRVNFKPGEVQISTLLSIKTGGCPEDCGYCSQSAFHKTEVKASRLMDVDLVIADARRAKTDGATRFCMGAAWRGPKERDMDAVCAMIRGVRSLGLETCVTLGMLSKEQAGRLKEAGLDFYNHNLDTSPEYYDSVVATHAYQDRLETLAHVREAGIQVCCGGIVGMGESEEDRVGLLHALATLPEQPESVPINLLVPIKGTKLGESSAPEPIAFVRTIAVARILMPKSMVRLSAGRNSMSDETQALCFVAGANSIFLGEKLLTADNPDTRHDRDLFDRLGLSPMPL